MKHFKSSSRKRKQSQALLAIMVMAYMCLVVFFLFNAYKHHFLLFNAISIIVSLLLVSVGIVSTILVWRKKAFILTAMLLLICSASVLAGMYVQKTAETFSQKLNQSAAVSETVMSIVVPVDSSVTDVTSLSTVLAAMDSDSRRIESLLMNVESEKGIALTPVPVSSYQEAYERLLSENSAMVLNSAYGQLLETIYPNYASQVKTIYTYTVTETEITKKSVTESDSFNIYISGIDTYGPITSVSRSDVNIIVTVNRTTHQILLTTTPRDAYVPIAGGGNNQYDKLTHAGIYGIDASIETLENLYHIDISYYARINFTSFIQLIDILGGIEIENDQEFTSLHGNYYFPKGKITLTSETALGFVRERYALADGDRDRGRNQNKVIAAIITKMSSPSTLTNFNTIIEAVGDSIQTDMPLATMMTLANDQLVSGQQFMIISQALDGTGSTGELTSYAMPTASLYMMSIDEVSLNNVTSMIHKTLEGK